MFARLTEGTAKPRRADEIKTLISDVMTLMRKQKGFLDCILLVGDTNPDEGAVLSLWRTKADAEMFSATPELKSKMEQLRPLAERINVFTFNVESSIFPKDGAAKPFALQLPSNSAAKRSPASFHQ